MRPRIWTEGRARSIEPASGTTGRDVNGIDRPRRCCVAVIGVALALLVAGCTSAESSSTPTSLPSILNPATADSGNADRTCGGQSIPNLVPTDTCAAWGKVAKGPWGIAVDVTATQLQATIITGDGVAQACTAVSYVNRTAQRVNIGLLNWALEVLPLSGPIPPYPADHGPTATSHLAGIVGSFGAIPPGHSAGGRLCFDFTKPTRGRFLLRADAPTPGDDTTSVFWTTNL